MNRQKSGGIEWVGPDGYTFNPIVGCSAGCPYCYAHRFAQRLTCPLCRTYEPHFHPERLADLSRGKPSRVFMGSMGDMFDPKVDPDWWRQILLAHEASGFRHRPMVLTKRPDRIADIMVMTGSVSVSNHLLSILRTIWLGVTVTCQADDWRIKELLQVPAAGHFICYEPALGELDLSDVWGLYEYDDGEWATKVGSRWEQSPGWVILGGLSGSWLPGLPLWGYPNSPASRTAFRNAGAVWANQIIEQAKAAGVPVFVKTKPVKLPGVEVIQEWPKGLEVLNES